MPASHDPAYLNAIIQTIRLHPFEEAVRSLIIQFPDLEPDQVSRDVDWAFQLKQRGYSRQEIFDDLFLA